MAPLECPAAPIARFSIEPIEANGLVLGFGGVAPPAIRNGVAVLREVLAEHLKPRRLAVVRADVPIGLAP